MRKVRATHRTKVIALLSERLEFERAAGELYAAVLDKLALLGGPFESARAHLRRIREEEKAHEEWLEEQLRSLGGGDAEAPLDVRAAWRQIAGTLHGTSDPARLFAALREAELLDSGGWELLREIADRAHDDEAREAFDQRLREEQQHLLFVNRLAAVFGSSDLLDETVTTIEEPVIGP